MKKIKDNKKYILIGTITILIITLILVVNKTTKVNNGKTGNNYVVVNNPSNFFTIENCINKFINTIYSKDSGNILLLLNDDYINDHGINLENVYNYVPNLSGKTTFQAKKIYKENNKYYVYGYLMEETIDSLNITDDYYVIININDDNIFDIIPYDGKIFKGGTNE